MRGIGRTNASATQFAKKGGAKPTPEISMTVIPWRA